MGIKRIILLSVIVLLAAPPFTVRYFRGKAPEMPERPVYIPIEEILPVHEQRIKDRIALLKQQSLDETFVYLLESQQYHFPGYHPQAEGPVDMESLLSTRSFLKVFQQFDDLPKDQAIKKLHEVCERAIADFGNSLEISLKLNENPSLPPPTTSIVSAKRTVCASMLLAARMGEHELVFSQIDEMQPLIDSYVERVKVYNPPEPVWTQISRDIASLEGDCVLTVLMYTLKRAGKDTSVPFEDSIKRKTIPLCRWDAPLTHYDFEVVRGLKKSNPQDIVEQFDVYTFAGNDRFDPHKRKLVFDTLQERLSK